MVKVLVECTPWAYACCDTLLTAEDVASASRFQNERRRNEHLAWRRVVRRELGRDVSISYNEVGAPIVDTPNTFISVAHGGGCVAVAIADERIGVDIESIERDFTMASTRYMSPEELLMSNDELWPAMVWCAKEALYKLYGKRGIELRTELQIKSYNADTKQLTAELMNERKAIVEMEIRKGEIIVATARFN